MAPVWLEMLTDFPVLLPHMGDLIIPTHPEGVPVVLPQLATWLISGNISKARKFQRRAQSCCSHHVDRSLPNPVTHYLGSGLAGIINRIQILFQEDYQYHSLNAYCSAISSVHVKADGYEVGKHPLVSRLFKGSFNQ